MLLPTTIDGLFLRDLRMDDFDGFSSWQHDPEIARCFAFTRTPRTQDETRRVLTEIVGGVHAYFGDYGTQSGDGTATISRADAQAQIQAASLALLERLEADR